MKTISIIGCGNIGQQVAQHWLAQHRQVHILSRQPKRLQCLQTLGAELQQGDLDEPRSAQPPYYNSVLYYFAPPLNSGTTEARVSRFLAQLNAANKPARIIYISTSGVYGDCQGQWVDETRRPNPQTDRSLRRFDAEQNLQIWGKTHNTPVIILRVGGIYGPNQPPLERLAAGMNVIQLSEAPYSNRIHADDLARICVAAERVTHSNIYNVCDGQTSSMSEYFITLAQLAGLPLPTQISKAEAQTKLSPVMLSYLQESRRMNITKLKHEFKLDFLYPTLEPGLIACLEPKQRHDERP